MKTKAVAAAGAMTWADQRSKDPKHRIDVDALLTEMNLTQDLVALRVERELTQTELADRLGVKQPVIAKLEGEAGKDIKLSTLLKVAAALGARVKIDFEKYEPATRAKRKTA